MRRQTPNSAINIAHYKNDWNSKWYQQNKIKINVSVMKGVFTPKQLKCKDLFTTRCVVNRPSSSKFSQWR